MAGKTSRQMGGDPRQSKVPSLSDYALGSRLRGNDGFWVNVFLKRMKPALNPIASRI
jgi:hypothetical protein